MPVIFAQAGWVETCRNRHVAPELDPCREYQKGIGRSNELNVLGLNMGPENQVGVTWRKTPILNGKYRQISLEPIHF